ncbi:MAG: GTP-binding protein [Pleurocapsa sp. SU_196_0]|nr:GTP-binding protein [Pleurocapsa sp. SU_196_0]
MPVTVLTGFLGSGKTTLLNRILTENHGQRIAVIENEFGEIGVDQDLVIQADEEIFEMNNGCICCTVRGDLIRILGQLMKRRDKFDRILIETTGLADPGPVAQTFFVDDDMRDGFKLDAVVTLVDAKHVLEHIEEGGANHADEAVQQIAFADVIVLNKIDLVSEDELDRLETRIRTMNGMAKVYRAKDANVDLRHVLEVGGFDLNRALELKPAFLEPEYPFEYGALYALEAGTYTLTFQDGPDPAMLLAIIETDGVDQMGFDLTLKAARDAAVLVYANRHDDVRIEADGTLEPSRHLYNLVLEDAGPKRFTLEIKRPGVYGLFSQHAPDEFDMSFTQDQTNLKTLIEHNYNPAHEHDDEVSSVGITIPGDLDGKRFNAWMNHVLTNLGPDIYRMKGILSIKGAANRYVFQGVHMLFDGQPDQPWGNEPRRNQLIFIGKNLDRVALETGFRACLT